MPVTATLPGPITGPIYDARQVDLFGVAVRAVLESGKVEWIETDSIRKALVGIDGCSSWTRCQSRIKTLRIRTNVPGVTNDCAFISTKDYMHATSGHPMAEQMVEAMSFICATLERDGVVVSPGGSERTQEIALLLKTSIKVDEIEKRVNGHDEKFARLEPKVDGLMNQIEDQRDARRHANGRDFVVDGLQIRGWDVDERLASKEIGGQFVAIAKSINDIVPTARRGSHACNLHLPETFTRWERDWGPKYRGLYSERRDRYGKDRPSLAWLKRNGQQARMFDL